MVVRSDPGSSLAYMVDRPLVSSMASEDTLREAFETRGYDVSETSVNRGRVRVTIVDSDPDRDALEEIVFEVIDEDDVMGFDVRTEASDAHDGFSTVVSFRDRS